MLNTKNIVQLEEGFKKVVKSWMSKIGNIEVGDGIENGRVRLEDGLPWLEVNADFSKATGIEFLQDLANELNIRMFFNRIEIYPEDTVLYGIFDLSPEDIYKEDNALVIRKYGEDDPDEIEAAEEFIKGYGLEVYPTSFAK